MYHLVLNDTDNKNVPASCAVARLCKRHKDKNHNSMRILITNDDGIYSPGIAALAKIATRFGEVRVVAPDVEQSSMGHAITASRPLYYKTSPIHFDGLDAYRVNGTPADCVALGTHLWAKTDVVLSGINMGLNLGNSMWHSGTLAGAKQAVLLGIKGIALSTPAGKTEPDFVKLEPYIEKALGLLLENKELGLFNVNFPPDPIGMKWTRQSVRLYDGKIVPGIDPMGRKHYWFTVIPLEPAEEGTDRWAVEQNYVSITPLRLDLTNEGELVKALQKQPVS
jgi:5'-nucleotidase